MYAVLRLDLMCPRELQKDFEQMNNRATFPLRKFQFGMDKQRGKPVRGQFRKEAAGSLLAGERKISEGKAGRCRRLLSLL